MTCKAGHVLNWDGFCRICGAWLVDINGPASPFPRREDSAESEGDFDETEGVG